MESENRGQNSETGEKDRNQDSGMEASPAKTGDNRADRGTNRRYCIYEIGFIRRKKHGLFINL